MGSKIRTEGNTNKPTRVVDRVESTPNLKTKPTVGGRPAREASSTHMQISGACAVVGLPTIERSEIYTRGVV